MGILTTLHHMLNLIAPALAMAVLLPALAFVWRPQGKSRWAFQFLVHFLLGSLCLVAGLLIWGVDGRMSTYLAMVVVLGSAQFWMTERSGTPSTKRRRA